MYKYSTSTHRCGVYCCLVLAASENAGHKTLIISPLSKTNISTWFHKSKIIALFEIIYVALFDAMSKLNFRNIGINVKRLREALGISQHDLSTLIPVSKRTIANLEAGNPDVSISHVNLMLEFFNLTDPNDLSKKDLIIKNGFREKLISHHNTYNQHFNKVLDKTPTIVYATKYRLLNSDFLNTAKEIFEIRSFFERLGWEYKSSSISNTLKRLPRLIEILPHPTKKNTNIYLKKQYH